MASSLPSKVMIIRHGEKLGDPVSEADGGKHLSLQGSARAAALPALFLPSWWQPPDPMPAPPTPASGPILECKFDAGTATFNATYEAKSGPMVAARFPAPAVIFATQDSHHSSRPVDTISPTASALSLPINANFSNTKDDIDKKLAGAVLNDYPGQVVLICWHHGTIPDVAKALGGTGGDVKWVGTVFDRLWLLDYSESANPPVQQFGQQLLFTDEQNVPSTPW